MRYEGSPRSSCRESNLVNQGTMFDASNQRSSSGIQESQKHFPLSQNVEESSHSTSPRSSPVVITTIQDSRLSLVGESGLLVLQPPDLNIDIQTLQDEVAGGEMRTEVETGDELHRPSNITASKSITQIDNQAEPDHARNVQATEPQQEIAREMLRDSETYSLPTPIGRFIPAPDYHSLNRRCTDTTVENDGTIIGRIASCYAGQLRSRLNAA
jgi:hypothetical protein